MLQEEYRVRPRTVPPREMPTSVFSLASGEFLFKEGHVKRHIYRVETGAICIYTLADASHKVHLEFLYAGDWFGFGYLERHACRARAVGPSVVTRLPLSAVEIVAKADPRAEASLKAAIEREFAYVRQSALDRHGANPMQRLAAFLLSLSSISRNEGRDASFIADTLQCGFVAECLTMSLDTLSSCLLALEERGLIEPRANGGLRIRDLAGLEDIADADTEQDAGRRQRSVTVGYEELP